MDLSCPLTDRHEIHTQVWCGVKPENLPAKFFTPPLKKFGGEKPQMSPNFCRPAVNRKRITSKRLNIWTNKNQTFHLRSMR